MDARILVVEDDRLLAKVLTDNLLLDGFEVCRARDANSAIKLAREFTPDLIVLDVMLPDRSGFEIFKSLHEDGRTPIIFLTARNQPADKVRGLNLGGDDYITKPFHVDEFLARVHAVLRRSRGVVERLTLGSVAIDFPSQATTKNGRPLHLTHQEFKLLKYLAERSGRVVYRSELLRAVWGYPDDSSSTRSVDYAIARLRKKIEPDPNEPRFVRTARGDGYALTPDAMVRGSERGK